MSLLNELAKEVKAVKLDGVADNFKALERGECVVGIAATEESQRLAVVYLNASERLSKKQKVLQNRLRKMGGPENATEKQLERIAQQHQTELKKFRFAKTVFLASVCYNSSELVDSEPISIRKNWQVAVRPVCRCEICEFRFICALVGLSPRGCIAL